MVFDNQPHEGSDESLPYPPHYETYYAHTKAIAERFIIHANSPQLLTVSLRPHLIWGPRDTHLLPRVIERAKTGRLVQVAGRWDARGSWDRAKNTPRRHPSMRPAPPYLAVIALETGYGARNCASFAGGFYRARALSSFRADR